MIPGSTLDALAARWAARPESGVFAALAEGLAKRGDLAEAARVAAAGLARYPGHAAGLIAQARIAAATGDRELARRALAILLERDPGHPLALELVGATVPQPAEPVSAESSLAVEPAAAEVEAPAPEAQPPEPPPFAAGLATQDPVWSDSGPGSQESDDDAPEPDEGEAPVIITESLAELYHRQGHLEEALAAYAELAARDPANDTVAARHGAVRQELAAQRPLPFDARQSAGRPVAAWLAGLAAVRPSADRSPASFDAFYDAPSPPPDATADFAAFQRWLEDLAR